MKRYKRILPSTLVLITLMSSITTEDIFATTRAEYVNNDAGSEVNSEATAGSDIQATSSAALNVRSTSSAALNVRATATNTETQDGWTFEYDSATLTAKITAASGKTGDVVIPSSVTINGDVYTVNHLDSVFKRNKEITSVVLPESITSIGADAFYECTNLKEVTIKGALKTLPSATFIRCEKLEKVTLSEGLETLDEFSFQQCTNLKYVDLPSTVEVIGKQVFLGCESLENIAINGNIKTLGNEAFSGCVKLEKIVFEESSEGIETIGQRTFAGCKNLTNVVLPSSTKTIGIQAFAGCEKLTTINTSNILELGAGAFESCKSLEEINASNLLLLSAGAFANCKSLEKIDISNIKAIPLGAFNGCENLKEVKLSETNGVGVGNIAFVGSGLRYIHIPENTEFLAKDFISTVVSAETTDPITTAYVGVPLIKGNEIPISSIELDDVKGKTLYMKYNIAPKIYLNGEKIDENSDKNIVFPAWIEEKDLIKHTGKPTRDGFEFVGWEVDADKLVIDGTERIVGNVKLTAKWSKLITYNFNDGITSADTKTQTVGETYKFPQVPSRDDYNFTGWYSDVDCKTEIKTDTIFTEDSPVMLYAGWERKTVNVTFDFSDKITSAYTEAQTVGEKYNFPQVPPRDGYNFIGWYSDVDCKTEIKTDTIFTATSPVMLYAGWEPTEEETPEEETPEEETPEEVETPVVETPVENNTDNNDNTDYNNDTVVSVKTDVNTTIDTSNVVNTKVEEVQPEKINKLVFNQFSVKAGSNEFITRYADGTVNHTYAYNKTYIDKRTKSMYVSLRGVIDNSIDKFEIKWNPKTSSAEVIFLEKGTKIVFTSNSSIMTVNGIERQMLSAEGEVVEAQLVNGHLMIPLRFVSELFNFNVAYDNDKKLSLVSTSRNEIR